MNAQKLINELIESGLTQVQLAELLDTSQGYVSDIVRGHRGKRISYEFATKLQNLWKERCQDTNTTAA